MLYKSKGEMYMKNEFVDYTKGLSSWQVQQRVLDGRLNIAPNKVTKSNLEIIKDNVCTLFNFLNVAIGVALFLVGAYSNMVYLIIIVMNVGIGIVQEIHAKNLVEQLTLLTKDKVKVIRDGKEKEVAVEEIVQDDILMLALGDQICADAVVVHEAIEVNESLLSGEADIIVKQVGDLLYSGSFVVGGKAYARVDKIGNESFSSQIINEVKQPKQMHSELIDAIKSISRFTSFIIVPVGILLFLQAFIGRETSLTLSIVNTAAALLGMLPKGLVLLIGIRSASGVIALSKQNVLVQDMHCMERFAHVDVLCLDKTGTITQGNMKVVKVESFKDEDISTIMGNYIAYASDNNATFIAMQQYFTAQKSDEVLNKIPFSSQRKWGSITFQKYGVIAVGAAEKMDLIKVVPTCVQDMQKQGYRVLLVSQNKLPIGMIILEDPIREHAKETFAYFAKEKIDVRVISGDHPLTVASTIKRAGLEGYENYVDASTVDDKTLRALAHTHKVFGRVSPMQKKILIQELQKEHTVAMSGDGVNDVLALRVADCSIAMAAGNAASKQVAQLVLLDNDFSNLPFVLQEGRNIINNITNVSSIFFIKTIYSFILSILCIVANTAFPFIPVQITFIDLIIEGYPSFFLSFLRNDKRIEGSYLKKTLHAALPYALIIILNFIILYSIQLIGWITYTQCKQMMYLILGYISIMAVYKACKPFHMPQWMLFISVLIGFTLGIFVFSSFLEVYFVGIKFVAPLLFFSLGILVIIQKNCTKD